MAKTTPQHRPLPGLDDQADGTSTLASRKGKKPKSKADSSLNIGLPVEVAVPDFSDPRRPKTCLEVDFPIVPINALSQLEGNAGKPIYQMSKWWARRRSCVFRAMLIAAAMQAPMRRNPDGSPLLDSDGIPLPDETEAAKAVWSVYYGNHQAAGNFKHLKVLDCFMGGGTTLVEGSRLGFQVAGVDLNPVAWFVVKNELACTDPDEVRAFFDQIEADVKPVIQPFYATECSRGHRGRWLDAGTGQRVDVDPLQLPPEERKKFRYEGPELVYTFWAKHGCCMKPGCGHRTPIFRSPVVAEKKLGVKYIELTCKKCKTAFHAELGAARMAPGAERVILDPEHPFTELSQAFAQRLLEYSQGTAAEKDQRIAELCGMVDSEPGLCCPRCGEFSGQFIRAVLNRHQEAQRRSEIDKKHLNIQPPRNGTKPVYCYLLVDPDWLKGAPGSVAGAELGGYSDATVDATSHWYEERRRGLRLIEVRGRIRLSEDASDTNETPLDAGTPEGEVNEDDRSTDDLVGDETGRKEFGIPRFITLPDGRRIDTRRGTVPRGSHFTCGLCGNQQDVRQALEHSKHAAPVAVYAIQGYCPTCDAEARVYGGRYFAEFGEGDLQRLNSAEIEWDFRRETDLRDFWPREVIPETYMTHHANFGLPKQGIVHWWQMFGCRQLLAHASMLRAISTRGPASIPAGVRQQVLGAFAQSLNFMNSFVSFNVQRDHNNQLFANNNFRPKESSIEISGFARFGNGNFYSGRTNVLEGLEWVRAPWETAPPELRDVLCSPRLEMPDTVIPGSFISCRSSSDLPDFAAGSTDLVITDPPFGDNVFYSDLSNFFHAWLRIPLQREYPTLFEPTKTPNAQEALAPRLLAEDEANVYYKVRLTACWTEACRILKDGGLLAFTFHHSEDSQWAIVLESLFDAGFILEQTFPIASDEQKGEGGQFGAKGTEYDIIHVCRKRLSTPTRVSWAKMRQWVKAELTRLRRLLEAYKARELSEADIRVILRGKALEFYSRHYGQVYTSDERVLTIQKALAGINQLLDDDTGAPGERPPAIVQPLAYQYLRLFGTKVELTRDEVSKSLRGTGIVPREFEEQGWVEERDKQVVRVPIWDRFERARQRPRKEMKSEIDQAHFLIGAALKGSGVNLEAELSKDTWLVRRSVEAVIGWYAQVAVDPEIREAAGLTASVLHRWLEKRRNLPREQQGVLFAEDDLDTE